MLAMRMLGGQKKIITAAILWPRGFLPMRHKGRFILSIGTSGFGVVNLELVAFKKLTFCCGTELFGQYTVGSANVVASTHEHKQIIRLLLLVMIW